jgi:hypothetical protein
MTHDELLAKLDEDWGYEGLLPALRAVVELHKPDHQSEPFPDWANCCGEAYPCQTIQAIEKELK